MDMIQVVVLIMVVTILATLTLAVVAYAAFRIRERRSPKPSLLAGEGPVFFERVRFVLADVAVEG